MIMLCKLHNNLPDIIDGSIPNSNVININVNNKYRFSYVYTRTRCLYKICNVSKCLYSLIVQTYRHTDRSVNKSF